jgi:hypothetical protein
MSARILGEGAQPVFYVFDTCHVFIRAVPALPHDPGAGRRGH